ncbi:MAG: hypothetical protein EOP52_08940 [Sphingobacteriales bacterium]|nr:MAG: hypothetical protein EOP52_08940 [Sphingobacteriales bacterium]
MMQKTLRALLPVLALAIGASSCSEDFDVLAPAKPYTVVYGILDANEPVNYVRIQRAYGDPNKSALDIAKLPDSSYFGASELTVTLQIKDATGSNFQAVGNPLERKDLTDKTPGVFFTASKAYEINTKLIPGRTYRLLIKNNTTGNVDTAQTAIVDLTGVAISELDSVLSPNQKIELAPTNPTNPSEDGTYTWRVRQFPQSPTVKFMDATIRFNFWERTGSGQETPRSVDYTFSRPVNPGGPSWPGMLLSDKFNNFYQGLINSLGEAPAGVQRLVDSADFIAYFGSPELYTYQQNLSQTGGLGGDQIQYRYTNIRGKDVLGVLGSRARLQRTGVDLTDRTVEALKTNSNTARANITGRSTQ